MSEGPDLVGLLYRADWTRLSLSAGVSTILDRDLFQSQFDDGAWPASRPWFGPWYGPWRGSGRGLWGGPPRPWPGPPGPARQQRAGNEWDIATEVVGTETSRFTLLIAPGRRYRQQGEGYLSGCDGERSWHTVEDDSGWTLVGTGGPEPPLEELFRPSWLLTDFNLEAGWPVTMAGRDGWRVTATPRTDMWNWPAARRPLDRVEVIVDAELGLLLRHEEILDGRRLRVTELTDVSLAPDPRADDAWCQPPGGWHSVRDDAPQVTVRRFAGDRAAWEVTKLAGGLAAAGLGALIKSSKFRPFEQATREEAEAEMPAYDGLPGDNLPVSDEVLHLVHASRELWAPGIAATLHEWNDVSALLSRVPDGARRAGFGGVGFLLDTAGERIDTAHTVSRLRLGSSGQYRIEQPASPGEDDSGRFARVRAKTVVCDGERRWPIGEDKVTVSPAAPPYDIPNLFDASWLLEYPLTGGAAIVAGGRRGYRLTVASGDRPGGCWLFVPDEVVVDAEFGIVLRWISLAGGRPVMRYELRDVVAGSFDPGDFRPDIPAGVKVVEETWDQPPSGPVNPVGFVARQAASQARSALRSVLGVIRGGDGP